MGSPNPDHLLEIYKLYARLADNVGQRREGAHRLFASLNVALMLSTAAIAQLGLEVPSLEMKLGLCLFGMILSFLYWYVIDSYRRLESDRHRVLDKLEKMLPFELFIGEHDPRALDLRSNVHRKLNEAGAAIPIFFGGLYLLILVIVVLQQLFDRLTATP